MLAFRQRNLLLHMMNRIVPLICLSLLAVGVRAQETRYITDILQLGLFAAQDGSGQPLRNLISGTEVTVLERIPNFARVRTTSGEEGWVKSAFLVAEKPAQARVAEAEVRIADLEQELALAVAARDSVAANVEDIVARAESELAEVEDLRNAATRLDQENTALETELERYRGALPWPWVAGALVVVLLAGFYAGYWWLDASIRRRHGGFRVY
jgi:SH3 domain protein